MLVVFSLSANAQSTRWVFFSEGGDGALHYYDNESILKHGNRIEVWYKVIWINHSEIDYTLARAFILCGERKMFSHVNYIYYYKDGRYEDKSIQNLYESELIYNEVYPETNDEVLYNIVCRK